MEALLEKDEYSVASRVLKECIDIQNASDTVGNWRLRLLESRLLYREGSRDSSIRRLSGFRSNKQISKEDKYEVAKWLSLVHKYNSKTDSSIGYFNLRFRLAREEENTGWQAETALDFGNLCLTRNELKQARKWLKEALYLSKNSGGLTFIKAQRALILLELQINPNIERIRLDSLEEALRSNTQWLLLRGRSWDVAFGLEVLSRLQWERNERNESLKTLNKVLNIYEEHRDSNGVSNTLNSIGYKHELLKEFNRAYDHYRAAFTLAVKLENWQIAKTAAENASYALEPLGRLDSALFYQRKSQELERDEVFNIEKEKAVSEFRVKYETEEANYRALVAEQESDLLMNIIIGLGLLIIISILVTLLFYQRLRSKRALHQKELARLMQEKELQRLGAMMEGQDSERKRIAEDLHDGLGGLLSMVKLHLTGIEDKLEGLQEQEKQQYLKANSLLDNATEQVRSITHNMMSSVLSKFGLVSALQDLRDSIGGYGKLRFTLISPALKHTLNSAQEIAIFRIIQELCNNTLKHAQAQSIRLELIEHKASLSISYEDDGRGFNQAEAESGEGLGLRNIRSRISQLGGSLQIESKPGKGSLFLIEIPMHD